MLGPDNIINISESLTTHSVWQNTIKFDPLERKLEESKVPERRKALVNIPALISRAQKPLPCCKKCNESINSLYIYIYIYSGSFNFSMQKFYVNKERGY